MKNAVFAVLLMVSVTLTAYYRVQSYRAETARELLSHQAASDQANLGRRLA